MSTENKYQFRGTQGEWLYQTQLDAYTHIVRAGGKFMCQLSQDTTGESKANAHLIAAAPELLQACILALKWLPSVNALPKTTETEIGNDTKQIISAIHKALNINELVMSEKSMQIKSGYIKGTNEQLQALPPELVKVGFSIGTIGIVPTECQDGITCT